MSDIKGNSPSGSGSPEPREEDFTGPYSPAGPATPCSPPISKLEIQALLAELSKTAPLQGAWTINEAGLPVAILHAHSEAHFRRLRGNISGVFCWAWNGVFGTQISFTLSTKHSRSKALPRMFLAPDSPFVTRFKETGRAAFAVAWNLSVGHPGMRGDPC